MLSGAERWVSRSVVSRADANGGIWNVEVAEEIMAVDLTVLGIGGMGIEGVFFDSSGKYGIFERVEASSLGSLNCRMALWSI